MQIGVDSFAAAPSRTESGAVVSNTDAMGQLLDRIEQADAVGLDVFGVGEHHRAEFLDSAPALIGGETHRFRPLIDLYRQAGRRAGYAPETLKVGLHSLGYVAATTDRAIADFYPGYAESFTRIGRERGWPPVTRQHFDAQNGPRGALLVGGPEEIAEKILRHSEALGGIDCVSLQMDSAGLPHEKLMQSIELLGTAVAPLVRTAVSSRLIPA